MIKLTAGQFDRLFCQYFEILLGIKNNSLYSRYKMKYYAGGIQIFWVFILLFQEGALQLSNETVQHSI